MKNNEIALEITKLVAAHSSPAVAIKGRDLGAAYADIYQYVLGLLEHPKD
jgi:hypothetical protein